jgi:hypothetical protein
MVMDLGMAQILPSLGSGGDMVVESIAEANGNGHYV